MELSPDQKLAGVLAPLFALRGQNDLGIGDLGALREFIDWSAEQGFRVVQLLPVNETGNYTSPYTAISSVALDPLTIEITPEALPDLTAEEIKKITSSADLAALREGSVIYPEIKELKWVLLERAFENFLTTSWKKNGKRGRSFRAFLKSEAAWLNGYTFFRVLIDENGGTERWDLWPEGQRSFAQAQAWLAQQKPSRRIDFERRLRLVSYVQWIAWEQWRKMHDYATSNDVALMGDIPFGVSYYSADVWTRPELFDHTWCGGCPPERVFETDPFTYKWGQNWGIPLYRWEVHREQAFDWWRQRVKKVRACFHLFRIDHILGFFRIYGFPWRPQLNGEFLPLSEEEAKERTGGELPHFVPYEDDTAAHKAANCAQGREVLKVLIEECGPFRLIGEDLGVVPDYVRPCLTELGIAGFKIPYWENDSQGNMTPAKDYQRLSVTTYATHDFEPLRATWEGWMAKIEAAEHGGPETHKGRDQAWHDVRRVGHWVGMEVPRITPYSDSVHEALMKGLFASNSWMAIYMITDIFATTQRFNVPGAVSDSNWSQRLEYPMVLWRKDAKLKTKMKHVRDILRATGRV